jgi:glycosyltransferase involved in cell wall biosynthesis
VRELLLVSSDVVGRTMAGPGIRYVHFARELRTTFRVTLAVPNEAELELEGVTVVSTDGHRHGPLTRLARAADVVVAQLLPLRTMRAIGSSGTRVVYDLYNPLATENLPLYEQEQVSPALKEASYRADVAAQTFALATGDAFVCASERQRDLWLGALAALGRIAVEDYAGDPTLRELVDVVPFGLEPEPPVKRRDVLKGVMDGIGRDDRVLLWAGGVWNWLDPLTPIRAVARLAERRSDVKLLFLGLAHPNPGITEMATAGRALDLARELGVSGSSVFFREGWTPYDERVDFLLEADLGVSGHLDTIESRFAFRTRVLDYFWAGLPAVVTEGDALAERIRTEGLGRTVPAGDVEAWTAAIEALLDDQAAYARACEGLAAVREELAWPRVVEPLRRVAAAAGTAPRPPARALGVAAGYGGARVRRALLDRGVAGTARRLAELALRRR